MSAELTYQLEPELRVGMPRSARIRAQEITAILCFALFSFVVALLIVLFAARDLSDLYTLRAHGVTEKAVVISKRKVRGKSVSYYLTYSLLERGNSIMDENEVSESVYSQKHEGDTVAVTFLPGQPQTHRLGYVDDARVRTKTAEWTTGLLAWSGFLGLIIALIAYDFRRELYLARSGVPAPALLTNCVAPQPNTKTTQYTITYRFMSPQGEQTQNCYVSSEVGKGLAAGTTVTVLYEASNPRHSCLYCALHCTELTSHFRM